MKTILVLTLLFCSTVAFGQYIRGTADTTVLPTTGNWEGRFISVAGKFYIFERDGWYQHKVDTLYHRDSLRVALRLVTPRRINGVNFDGTQDISVPGGASDSAVFVTVTREKNDTTLLSNRINGRAAATHTHAESDVTNLTTDLGLKLNISAVKQGAYFSDTSQLSNVRFDTANFTTTGLRLAVSIPGMTNGGWAEAKPRPSSDATPNASDIQLTAWCKKDSVIIHRIASGTSGLKVNLLSKKKLN